MSRTQTCPNCPGSAVKRVFTIRQGNRVVRCTRCDLQFAELYPDFQEADAGIYTAAYFRKAIEEQQKRQRIFSKLLAELESVLHRKGRLLDVGAGEGTLLQVATEQGWQAEGIDVASAMVRHVREELGLVMHHGVLEDVALPERCYDAVIMNHVLEHVKNPVTALQKISRLLRKDGAVRIEVPNLASLSSGAKNVQSRLKLKRNPWKHYSTEHHFWFFTPRTLKTTLETAGLTALRLEAPARQWSERGLLDRLLDSVYGRTRWGGHIVAYARPAGSHSPRGRVP
ncbi:MAG: class I SAM-dependent methyltransferase [Candidatus Krumholzibacteriia bacterium]